MTLQKVNAYLNCMPQDKAVSLWREKLTACGFFDRLPVERIPVTAALGRVTADNVYALLSSPHYNGAAMDGIAVRSRDTFGASETTPIDLTVLAPGAPFAPAGCYVVDTGDLLPPGTDAVIMVEDVQQRDGRREIIAAAAPWQHVRIIGEDIVAREMILSARHVLTPPDIAALLAGGLEEVAVTSQPRVTVIPTGSELVDRAADLTPGAILDVNSHMLCAAVQSWGGIARRHAIVADDYAAIRAAVAASLADSDLVITNAGTSAGTEDFTSRVLAELGEVLVHGVAIKPGKPVILALCGGVPVVGLPGYPVSAMLTAELFIRDILYDRQRLSRPFDREVEAVVARQLHSAMGVEEHVRVSVGEIQGKMVAAPISRGAGLLSSLTKAQGVLTIPAGRDGLTAGERVRVQLRDGCRPENSLLAVGSHDLALDILASFLNIRAGLTLSCANVGSMGGIMAVRNNETHIAGVHLLDAATGQYNISYLQKYLERQPWRLFHLARREQGLMVAPGNPRQINSLADLNRPGVTFANRQRGAGTRALLDYRLQTLGLAATEINGYEKEVGTHMAVAASIAGGSADAGMGIRAAAVALGLDFIPVAYEDYELIFNFPPEDSRAELLLGIFRSAEFRQEVERLGGYDLADCGRLVAKNE